MECVNIEKLRAILLEKQAAVEILQMEIYLLERMLTLEMYELR